MEVYHGSYIDEMYEEKQRLFKLQQKREIMGKGIFSGYKTYVVGALTIVAAIAAYTIEGPVPGAEQPLSLPDLAQLIVTAILGMTIRHGVSNKGGD